MSSDPSASARSSGPRPTAEALRATFDSVSPLSIGLEDEVMLLDPATLELAPRAEEVLERLSGDPRFKLELPAAQLEIVTPAHRSVAEAVGALGAARRTLAGAAGDLVRPAAAAVHPFSSAEGILSGHERYAFTRREYAGVARRQMVYALQVHVAVGGAERTLAVYNALRSLLPEIAAVAANGPFYDGRDTGLASMRPKISETLPRQGIPPRIASWEAFARALEWGAAAGAVPDPRVWWWELRPHLTYGTLEVRVPDAQTTLAEAAGVAAFVHCAVAWLAARHDAGEALGADPTWRIEENRWSACRYGVEGTLADLQTGERRPARERLHALLERLDPVADGLGCAHELAHARGLVEVNGTLRQRAAAGEHGDVRSLAGWLADRFLEGAWV